MPIKIFVGNLQVESNRETEDALRRLFEQFGKVLECDILTGKNFGFVHMQNEKEADIAIAALHGEEFFGGQINVERSDNQGKGKKPPRSGGGGGGGGGGFRGRGGRGGFGRNDRGGGGRGGGRNFGGSDRRSGRYDPYSRNGRDPYGRDPYDMPRDPYERDPYARDPYARDMFARDAFTRDMYGRAPYSRSRMTDADAYSRPPPEYYDRSGISRDSYFRSAGGVDRELVSYPMPRASGFSKDGPGNGNNRAGKRMGGFAQPQTTSLYTEFK